MNMKRILAVLTALAMILALAGCSGSGETAAETGATAAPTAEAEAVSTASETDTDIASQLQYLVDEGVIAQDTLDAIVTYMETNGLTLSNGMGGEMPEGQQDGSAPEMPSGEMPSGGMGGGKPNAMLSEDILTELLENGVITQSDYDAVTEYQENQRGSMGGGDMGGAPGGGTSSVSYTAASEITEAAEVSGETYTSETADENALLINTTESVSVTDATVTKTGDSDGGDSCSFYGLNAAVLAMGGADVTISGGSVTTDADGANGIFSYGGNGAQNGSAGDGTTVTVSDTVITTSGDNAGGIMTTGGGITNANNLTVSTSGRSSAAIRTDRGGGTVTVTGGSYTTSGLGSPAVYSTADITVSDAELTSELSEGVCIEGKNSVTLTDCDLTANNTQCNGNATFFDSVNIYQSMSGDADSGTSAFTMTGGTLTSRSGHVFHVTNTHAVITLSGVEIVNEDSENVLLSVCDDGWSGAENRAELVCSAQTLSGNILVGSNSYLTLTLKNGSSFTGTFSGIIQNSRGESVSAELGEVSVTLDETSTWTLTADTYITSFTGNASQIISNGYTLYVNGVALTGTK